jgi:hypothetical protein
LEQAATDPDTIQGVVRTAPSDIRVLPAELAELLFGFGQYRTIPSDAAGAGDRGPRDMTSWDDRDLVADLARHALSERDRVPSADPLDPVPGDRGRTIGREGQFKPLRDDLLFREACGQWDDELGPVR